MQFLDRIRPNMVLGLVCLAGVSLLATFHLSAEDAKEVLLVVTAGIICVLKDLLGMDARLGGKQRRNQW